MRSRAERGARHHLGRAAAHASRRCCGTSRARKAWCVRLDEPSWWYRQAPSRGIATSLQPLGALYGWAAQAALSARPSPIARGCRSSASAISRPAAPARRRSPSICASASKAAGHEPVALTRGYGGRLAGPYWVDARDRYGARRRRRGAAARHGGADATLPATAAPARAPSRPGRIPATVIVMDDGLQNPGLAKDLTIAVVDGAPRHRQRLVMPAGPLRAPLEFQLELTDAIVVNERSRRYRGPVTSWLRRRFAGPVLRAATVPAEDTDWLKGARRRRLGRHRRAGAVLRHAGRRWVRRWWRRSPFAIIEQLGESDARRLLELARAGMRRRWSRTEKDMARLAGSTGAAGRAGGGLARAARAAVAGRGR